MISNVRLTSSDGEGSAKFLFLPYWHQKSHERAEQGPSFNFDDEKTSWRRIYKAENREYFDFAHLTGPSAFQKPQEVPRSTPAIPAPVCNSTMSPKPSSGMLDRKRPSNIVEGRFGTTKSSSKRTICEEGTAGSQHCRAAAHSPFLDWGCFHASQHLHSNIQTTRILKTF